MSRTHEESKQLDAEIKLCIAKHGSISGYGIVKCIQAPPMTIRDKLKRMVEKGELNSRDNGRAKLYSLPLTVADLPDGREERAPKMVSRGPQKARESAVETGRTPPKLYASGRQRRGKSMVAMAFEGNGKRKEPLGGESQ